MWNLKERKYQGIWTTEYVQIVLGLDDQAPACPDGTGSCESCILGEGELFSWAIEICYAGKNNTPLNSVSGVPQHPFAFPAFRKIGL